MAESVRRTKRIVADVRFSGRGLLFCFLSLIFMLNACRTVPEENAYPKNFHRVNDDICRSGQPSAKEMAFLFSTEGIRSVLNLRDNHDDEDEIGTLDIRRFDIPLSAGSISEDDLVEILRTVKSAPKPILIHCWHGSDRTGAAVAACRIVLEDWSVEQAVSELMEQEYGHHRTLYQNIPDLLRKADWDRIRTEVSGDLKQ
ncbi:MAG: dual specificity protein phosphatase family protein [Lentisphaeria bacterium]|nr:dual specificity protein phosphatase family protein [Lentisphaeria bacterium]